ncbi:MAG: hypothetical protein JST78_09410 [Bacteroidetes bacterium]|nr:hypothetical protein [Bacteroidota bacterium]
MKTVELKRMIHSNKEVLGILSVIKENGQLFVCKTLELAWKANANNISCIPPGSYECQYSQSTRMTTKKGHPVYTYEILNVPNRAGIRIHASNFFSDLLGCIALGDANADINGDGILDVTHSVATIAAFEQVMKYQNFTLVIH